MNQSLEPFDFPELPDEGVIAINNFLEEFWRCFQNHYFAQMLRYERDLRRASRSECDPRPFSDPPF